MIDQILNVAAIPSRQGRLRSARWPRRIMLRDLTFLLFVVCVPVPAAAVIELASTTGSLEVLSFSYNGPADVVNVRDENRSALGVHFFLKCPPGSRLKLAGEKSGGGHGKLTIGSAWLKRNDERRELQALITGEGTFNLPPPETGDDKQADFFNTHAILQPYQGAFTRGVQNEKGTVIALDEHILSNSEAIAVLMQSGNSIRVITTNHVDGAEIGDQKGHHHYVSVRKIEGDRLLIEEFGYGSGGTYHVCYWAVATPMKSGSLRLIYDAGAEPPQSELRFPDEPLGVVRHPKSDTKSGSAGRKD